jgi:hypothetical protein
MVVKPKANIACNTNRCLTFKDLQKLIHSQENSEQTILFGQLRNKPF